MKKEKEIWKDIEGYEGLYQVSSHGRVKSLERKVDDKGGLRMINERILKPRLGGPSRRKYYSVILCKYGKMKSKRVNRLAAQYFVPNPNNLPEVNHLDNDPLNNYYENLEWCTSRKNKNHGMTFKETSSNYPGVCWDKSRGKWKSNIYINGRLKYLGRYDFELEAAESYQTALKQVV